MPGRFARVLQLQRRQASSTATSRKVSSEPKSSRSMILSLPDRCSMPAPKAKSDSKVRITSWQTGTSSNSASHQPQWLDSDLHRG